MVDMLTAITVVLKKGGNMSSLYDSHNPNIKSENAASNTL